MLCLGPEGASFELDLNLHVAIGPDRLVAELRRATPQPRSPLIPPAPRRTTAGLRFSRHRLVVRP